MKTARISVLFTIVVLCLALISGFAAAAEKMDLKGKISGYDLEAKTVTVMTDEGKEMTFSIESKKALEKLDDRLFKGDEVKIRYTEKDGKKLIRDTNDLKGTKPGC
ncbi:MAG: hypothetical protein HZB33_05815 [Nitrospirae bacterium]|nr:hypothetical protein [Nitrospirota bacterium]